MSAFKDSGHLWWQQCQRCRMAWFVGDKPADVDEDATCAKCDSDDLRVTQIRAEALEGAALICDAMTESVFKSSPEAEIIRALIATPAPASIPVERVREAVRETRRESPDMTEADESDLLRRLGVDLDGTDTTCRFCPHPKHDGFCRENGCMCEP